MHIIYLLADGKFHSGQEIGNLLGISRTAVWKQLKKLETTQGLSIQSVHGKGYRLNKPLSLLNQEILNSDFCKWPIQVLEITDSTNTACHNLLTKQPSTPIAITTEQQTSGKGRRGRQWISPYGQNIYYSLLMSVKNGYQQISGLSLTVGLAVVEALQEFKIKGLGLKWPNDILINDKKLAGILLELSGDPADVCHVIIGIGINVNMQEAQDHINQPWTSLALETGQIIDRNQLIISLSHSLNRYLAIHFQKGFTALKEEWQNYNLWQHKMVNLSQGNQQISGKMLGVDDTGALILNVNNNEIQHFNTGEVSLRLAP